MNKRNELIEQAAYQLSLDFACEPGDFFAPKNRAVLSSLIPGRRAFKDTPDFFKMASFGGSVVASVSAEMLAFTKALLAKFDIREPAELFDGMQLYLINKELSKWNKTIGDYKIYFLPKTPYKAVLNSGFNLRVYNESEINSVLHNYKGFNNALMYQAKNAQRRDITAVCAFNGSSVAGIAGASSDSERFWQIGIDVNPEYRGKGLAADLVTALTKEIFSLGAIPYYGTWAGNIASQNVALKCGYYPTWTEVAASDTE